MVGWLARATRVYLPPHVIKQEDVLTNRGGRMTNTQSRSIMNGPNKERLRDAVFEPQKRIGVTFTLEGGGLIDGIVKNFSSDYQRDGESWILELHDSSARLGPMWLKCRYNSRTRKGEVVYEIESKTESIPLEDLLDPPSVRN